jgi:hypothetical protein
LGKNWRINPLVFSFVPRCQLQSMNNGGEFALHERLDASLGCTSHFCDPAGLTSLATNPRWHVSPVAA